MSYSGSGNEEAILGGAILVVLLITGVVVLLVYVLSCIGLYKMAQKAGYASPILAWIPIAQTWVMFVLPKNEFVIPLLNKTLDKRSTAFWIYLALPFASGILALIPFIGWLVDIAGLVAIYVMSYRVWCDLFAMYDSSTASRNAILTVIFPILGPIFLLANMNKPLQNY